MATSPSLPNPTLSPPAGSLPTGTAAGGSAASGPSKGFEQLLPGEGNLWGSILDSVSSNREKGNTPTRTVIVLGERGTGKSTLVSYLAGTASLAGPPMANGGSAPAPAPAPAPAAAGRSAAGEGGDLGMSYLTVDVTDEGDEEALARLSVHQLPSAAPPYSALLPLTLTSDTLRESLVVILLPFSNPYTMLVSFVRWLSLLHAAIAAIRTSPPTRTSDRGEVVVEEAQEDIQSHWRAYTEPGSASATSNSAPLDADIPLPQGTLVMNLGVPILVACTKSDHMDILERQQDFKEEQFDYMQQALRTICLRYGAALFFTASPRPDSLKRLREYILHRLFGGQHIGQGEGGAAAAARAFGFSAKANVVDRDGVMVPSGWDSWGKIKVLREGFDPESVGDGWEVDLEREGNRRAAAAAVKDSGAKEVKDNGANGVEDGVGLDNEGRRIPGACRMWEDIVGDPDDSPIQSKAHNRIVATDEQSFLKTHFETLQKEREKDPRAHFQTRPSAAAASSASSSATLPQGDWTSTGVGVVGPMGSTSLSLPSVERALERDAEDVAARMTKMVRKDSSQTNGAPSRPAVIPGSASLSASLSQAPGTPAGKPATTARSPLLSPGAAGRADKEVLATFFEKLLQKDGRRPGTGGKVGGTAGGAPSGQPNGT